jgi:hypothetical protein
MSDKIVQLTLFPLEEKAQDTLRNMLRGLFARDHLRMKEIEKLMDRNLELEEAVFRIKGRLDRLTENSPLCQ